MGEFTRAAFRDVVASYEAMRVVAMAERDASLRPRWVASY
jgi:hypothetical protein